VEEQGDNGVGMSEADRLELCMLLKDMYLVMVKVAGEGNVWERAFAELMKHRIEKVAEKWCRKEGHE